MEKTTLKSNFDNLELSVMYSAPVGEPKAVLQLVHGMAEHKERYAPLMDYLAKLGYASVIHDHRGHGESIKGPDTLGYMFDGGWNALVEDIKTVMDWTKSLFPGTPVYLMGHSMGSLAVRSFVKRYDSEIEGLIVCGCPSDNKAKGAGKLIAGIIGTLCGGKHPSKLLNAMSFGSYDKPFPGEGKNAWLSASKANVEAYNADPLCGYCFTANGFKNLFSLMEDCYSPKGWAMANPEMPILFISGAQDPCRIDDKAFGNAVEFIRKRGYKKVSSKLYPGLRHEILNEESAPEIYQDIAGFLGD